MKKLVLVAAAAATFAMIVPAAAQSVSVGVSAGQHRSERGVFVRERAYQRGDRVVIQSRTHVRPRADRVVIIKKKRPRGHAYGLYKPNPRRTVIFER